MGDVSGAASAGSPEVRLKTSTNKNVSATIESFLTEATVAQKAGKLVKRLVNAAPCKYLQLNDTLTGNARILVTARNPSARLRN